MEREYMKLSLRILSILLLITLRNIPAAIPIAFIVFFLPEIMVMYEKRKDIRKSEEELKLFLEFLSWSSPRIPLTEAIKIFSRRKESVLTKRVVNRLRKGLRIESALKEIKDIDEGIYNAIIEYYYTGEIFFIKSERDRIIKEDLEKIKRRNAIKRMIITTSMVVLLAYPVMNPGAGRVHTALFVGGVSLLWKLFF